MRGAMLHGHSVREGSQLKKRMRGIAIGTEVHFALNRPEVVSSRIHQNLSYAESSGFQLIDHAQVRLFGARVVHDVSIFFPEGFKGPGEVFGFPFGSAIWMQERRGLLQVLGGQG